MKTTRTKGLYDFALKEVGIGYFKRKWLKWKAKQSFNKFLNLLK